MLHTRIIKSLLYATFPLLLWSCSQTIPFTGQVQQKYKLSENDLKGLQFFTSSEIVLYKASGDAEARTAGGSLIVESDRQVDRIVIPRGTPGTVVQVYPDKLAVSFDTDAGKNLLFGSKYIDGNYRLMAQTWDKKHGELVYGRERYIAAPGSGEAFLLIKLKKMQHTKVKSEVAGGRRIVD